MSGERAPVPPPLLTSDVGAPAPAPPPPAYGMPPQSPNRRAGGPVPAREDERAGGERSERSGAAPLVGPDGEGIDGTKYKTRMCANFINGTCTWGDRCAFAHGDVELRAGGVGTPTGQGVPSFSSAPQGRAPQSPLPPSYDGVRSPVIGSPKTSRPVSPRRRPSGTPTPMSPNSAAPPGYPQRFRHEPYSPSKPYAYHAGSGQSSPRNA